VVDRWGQVTQGVVMAFLIVTDDLLVCDFANLIEGRKEPAVQTSVR
jgi:hypothetical protein